MAPNVKLGKFAKRHAKKTKEANAIADRFVAALTTPRTTKAPAKKPVTMPLYVVPEVRVRVLQPPPFKAATVKR